MYRIVRFCFLLGVFAFMIYCLTSVFNMSNTLFTKIYLNNGDSYITFDLYGYLGNFNGIFDKFTNNISNLGENHYNWSDFFTSIKSLCNVVITILNALILPLSLIGSLLSVLCAFFGLPLNNTNPIFNLLDGMGSLQIPYIAV